MPAPAVSVIIPTYNGSRYLRATIASALSQTHAPCEVIVVDDCSSEDIESLVRTFGEGVHYRRGDRRSGPAAARNLGARLAKGEFLAFLDHDDLWMPNKTRAQLEPALANPKCALVYSHPVLIDGAGKVISTETPCALRSGDAFLGFLSKNRIGTFSAALVRTSSFVEVGGLDESPACLTCDDYDLWLRLSRRFEVHYVGGENLVHYRVHDGNLVGNYEQNLSAHEYVLRKWMIAPSGDERHAIRRAIRENRLQQYRHFAPLFYHRRRDYRRARDLWAHVLLRCPLDRRAALYFALCCLPTRAVERLRSMKRRVGED